ncbi:MAG: hypothetical protein D6767_07185 [Candidatus Hydrogenedentota bacterium]|nr:MAG: hypothetical protein D6767_07185 [Candidatus Hydrogenedentota bacterium]
MIDIFLVSLYLLSLAGIGYAIRKKESSLSEFLLANRSMAWPISLASLYATAASALTFIGVPGVAYAGDFYYLSLTLGSLLGRIFIAYFLLKAYFHFQVFSIYELLEKKFSITIQKAGSGIFILTRILASSVRLTACAFAIAVILKISIPLAIVIIAMVAFIYTFFGGIRAVMITDVLQFIFIIGGSILAFSYLLSHFPGDLNQFLENANAQNKFQIVYWEFNWNDPKTIWAGTLFGFVVTLAGIGCDQDLMQRMLTTKSYSGAKKAMIFSGILDIPVVFLFLSIGALLFGWVQESPDLQKKIAALQLKNDMIFPYFMKEVFPAGLRGLLIVGLLSASLSSLDSALNALASVSIVDFPKLKQKLKSTFSIQNDTTIARIFTILFAMILAAVAILFADANSILWVGFKAVGYTYGPLLALFLFSIFSKEKIQSSTGILLGIILSFLISFFSTSLTPSGFVFPWEDSLKKPLLAWPWGIVIATLFMSLWLFLLKNFRPHKPL